jgi:hypothetical protein
MFFLGELLDVGWGYRTSWMMEAKNYTLWLFNMAMEAMAHRNR